MKLDVRSKVLLVLFANLAFLFRVSGWLELIIVSGLAMLLYFAEKGKIAVYSLLAFVLKKLTSSQVRLQPLWDIMGEVNQLKLFIWPVY